MADRDPFAGGDFLPDYLPTVNAMRVWAPPYDWTPCAELLAACDWTSNRRVCCAESLGCKCDGYVGHPPPHACACCDRQWFVFDDVDPPCV